MCCMLNIVVIVMREYMSIAVRSDMHFVAYRYCRKGQPCKYSLETLGECQE